MLALIAGTVSHLHMHLLVELHGQPGWVAALMPLMPVDGMIVSASTTLLAESRSGHRGGLLAWALSQRPARYAPRVPKARVRYSAVSGPDPRTCTSTLRTSWPRAPR